MSDKDVNKKDVINEEAAGKLPAASSCLSKNNKSKAAARLLKNVLTAAAVAAFWIAVWQLLSLYIGNKYILPAPKTVLKTMAELVTEKNFWINTANSLLTIFKGFLIAQLAGILLACVTSKISVLKTLFSPIMSIVKATPIASFIILLLVLLGKDYVPETAAFLIVLPTVWENMSSGINSISKELSEVAFIYKFRFVKKMRYLYIPSIMPFFIPALKSTFGMAWKAGIAAEVLCNTKNSIGGEIYSSKVYLEVPQLFAWTAAVIIISICFEKLLMLAVNKITKKDWVE